MAVLVLGIWLAVVAVGLALVALGLVLLRRASAGGSAGVVASPPSTEDVRAVPDER